ncbi:hypothetical protein QBC32DRAFT_202439 [Pseudoneurospora amorphoporcata]|uniref:Uncharacterized protein n=1 Tax=Pseudoneurospora amorphoporcata TaxID=241081 RepID=A0AAN6SJH9_9PEZI|nr:hypothetical protein QBC32DRAFT_202439 [Pseudoneurospora amorphoporcata]
MATPNYTSDQISALRTLRARLRSAKYDWEVRQLLKNTATAAGLKQLKLVQWQDEEDNRKNLLHWLVDGRLEKVAIMIIQKFWSRKEAEQRQLMRIIRYPKCYIDSPQGGSTGEYTVERLAEARNCEQLVDIITRCRELYPSQAAGEEGEEEEEEEETREERARTETEQRMVKHLQRISTPSPPDLPSTTGTPPPNPPLVAANSSLHVVAKKTPRLAARQASSVSRTSTPKLLLARGGTPQDIPIWSSGSPPAPSARTQTEKRTPPGTGHQPSTPPPLFIPCTPPGAPGARDTPLWYPPSEESEHSEPDAERVQRAREDQLVPLTSTPSPVRCATSHAAVGVPDTTRSGT